MPEAKQRLQRAAGDLIKEWVGHSTLKVTSRYTHFDDSFRQNTQFTEVVEKRDVSQVAW